MKLDDKVLADNMSSTTVQQSRPTSGQRDGLTVLNAASQVVLERTIVEAFVKLVVCRNITVQRVVAGSGHVLDSHTTQEEESPVILDVHRHEVGGGCSTRSYPTLPLLSDSLLPDHIRHPPSPSSTQCRDSDQHTGRGQSSEDTDKRGTCNSAQNEGSSACPHSRAGSLPHRQEKSKETEKNVDRQCSLPKPSGCQRPSAKVEQTVQDPCVKTDVGHRMTPVGEKSGQADRSLDALSGPSQDICEDPHLKLVGPSAAEASEISEGGRVVRKEHCEGLNTQTRDNPSSSLKDPGTDLAVLRTAGRKGSTQDLKRAAGEGSSMMTAGEGEEELMEHCSAEGGEELGHCGPGQGCPEEKHFGVGSEKQTEHGCEVTDTEEKDVEMTSLEETVSDGRKESVTSQVKEPLTLTAAHQSCSQSSIAGIQDSAVQGESQNSDNSGNDHVVRDIHVGSDEGQHSANRSSTAADQLREVMREGSGDMDSKTSVVDRSSQPTEDDAEQDMLVIDLSNTVLEQTPSNTGHEQTNVSTDSEQSQPNTDSEQTQPGTEGEQTHENIDSIASGDGPEQSAQSAEKPDPFFHLLTNFPVRDRFYSKASPSSAENKIDPQTSKPVSACSIPHSSSIIKEEPDDDCMITAAFMSPSRENRNRHHGPVPHTVTTATSVASSRVWRGGEVGGAARQRQVMRSRGQYRHTPVLPPLQRPVQDYQVNPDLAAVPSTSAMGFPARTSSSSSSSSHPDTSLSPTTLPAASPAYIPNFLATTTLEVSERMESGGVMSASEDRVMSGDVSQTYQCLLCNKIFMHHFKYARHVAMCGGRRPFKCKICGKAFNQRAHLDTHMKFHMGIKRHRCDVCHKAYVMKGDLIRHLKTRGHLLALQSYGLPVQS